MASDNDQVVRTVPNTDVGGHDTSGVDGETRTERSGELLGTPDPRMITDADHQRKAAELVTSRADFVAEEVDRANREDLPRLGGNVELEDWRPEKGGSPAGLETTTPRAVKGSVTTADVAKAPKGR